MEWILLRSLHNKLGITSTHLRILMILPSLHSQYFTKKHRLEDVMALIQALALGSPTYRSEKGEKLGTEDTHGLQAELQGTPKYASTWTQIAMDHQEFFRVAENKLSPISLILRHSSREPGVGSHPLTPDLTKELLAVAIELHDRQVKRSERWVYLVPIWVALIAGSALVASKVVDDILDPPEKDKGPTCSTVYYAEPNKVMQSDFDKLSPFVQKYAPNPPAHGVIYTKSNPKH